MSGNKQKKSAETGQLEQSETHTVSKYAFINKFLQLFQDSWYFRLQSYYIRITTCFHEFSGYESANLFTNILSVENKNLIGQREKILSFEHLKKSKQS